MTELRFAAPVEDRVALITGGARGIGRACALRLAADGRDIAVLDMAAEADHPLQNEIEAMGRCLRYYQTDVTNEAAVHDAVANTVRAYGRLDILVCCAGILGDEASFLEQSSDQFERVMRVNVFGVYYAHQAAIPHMLKQSWGRCVTITSGARRAATNQVPYGVSKGAVFSLIGALGNAYPAQGVFVNGVEPGRVLTDMVVPRFSPEFIANPGTPIGRYADPEELAEVVAFLTSERNTYTTGAVWSVKGATG